MYVVSMIVKCVIFLFWCMCRESCTVTHPGKQVNNIYIYINSILYIISTPYTFRYTHTIFRESYPLTLLKL